MGVFAHNMETNIFCEGCKGILHKIMGLRPLPTMNATKKVIMNPHMWRSKVGHKCTVTAQGPTNGERPT